MEAFFAIVVFVCAVLGIFYGAYVIGRNGFREQCAEYGTLYSMQSTVADGKCYLYTPDGIMTVNKYEKHLEQVRLAETERK